MAEKFRNKYRSATSRLSGYDYSCNGKYFITICTRKHICYFGDIVVETSLRPVSAYKNDSSFKIDPSYIIGSCNASRSGNISDSQEFECSNKNIDLNNSTVLVLSREGEILSECWFDLPNHYLNIFLDEYVIMPNHFHGIIIINNQTGKPQIHGLSEIVRALKSFSSRRIHEFRKSDLVDIWQPRFYDHIIRSENELNRIQRYIRENPRNWFQDEHHSNSNNR